MSSSTKLSNFQLFITYCEKKFTPFQLETEKYKGPAIKIAQDQYTREAVVNHFPMPLIFIKLEDSPNVLVAYPNVVNKDINHNFYESQPEIPGSDKSGVSPWYLLHSNSIESTYLLETEQESSLGIESEISNLWYLFNLQKYLISLKIK